MKFFLIFFFLFFIFTSGIAVAIGVSNSPQEIYFLPGDKFELSLYFSNDVEKEMVFSVEDSLAKYATINPTKSIVGPKGKKVMVEIKIPTNFADDSGILYVRAEEAKTEGAGMFETKLSVRGTIYAFKKVTGKQIVVYLYREATALKETQFFEFSIKNAGTEDINKAIATVHIFENGKEILSTQSKPMSLSAKESKKAFLEFPLTELVIGKTYSAAIEIDFDGNKYTYVPELFVVEEPFKKREQTLQKKSSLEEQDKEKMPEETKSNGIFNKEADISKEQSVVLGLTKTRVRGLAVIIIALMIIFIYLFKRKR